MNVKWGENCFINLTTSPNIFDSNFDGFIQKAWNIFLLNIFYITPDNI